MTHSRFRRAFAAASMALLLAPTVAWPQVAEMEQRAIALSQSVAQDRQRIRQYEWIETTVISVAGDEKSREQKRCYYGADGGLTKITISETAEKSPPGLRGLVAERKKEELTDYMKRAKALMLTYIPPNPEKILAVREAGNISLDMPGAGMGARLNFRNYAKSGDMLTVEIDPVSNRVTALRVATYVDGTADTITLDVRLASLDDGTGYPSTEVLVANAERLVVNVTNSGYRKVAN